MHKSQVFFYLLSSFILGVFWASFFHFSVSLILILSVASISIIVLSGFTPPLKDPSLSRAGFRNKYFILAGFLILVFAGGIARFNHFSAIGGSASGGNFKSSLVNSIGHEVLLDGYIDSEPDIDGNRTRFVFKTGSEKILITTNAFPKRGYGDTLSIKGTLELPQNFTEFDYIAYLKKDGIRTTIFYPKEIKETGSDLEWSEKVKVSTYRNIFSLKNKFQNAINLSIPEPNAAFMNGILLGTRQNIPDDLKDAFSKTGTTHILAISGYNIMIISEAILLGLIWFFKRRVAFWISVAIIILFVILTGASASVVRAAVMGLLLSFAHGYGRLYDQKNSIILAGGVMIYHNPFVLVFDVGFQLSFAAVLGLIYIYPWLDYKLYKIWKLGGLKELFLMTLSAQTAVAPLLIYYFGNFSLISLPTNVLILSFLPYAMLAGFVAGLAGMILPVLGQIIGYIAWAITEYQIKVVELFASL
ncbi:MAG: ComEC/Rec2 family competence protein [Candidatus Taylorbacteria bacterium]|nr:ComEC/Rec2 family competence protein [Candidatus Taylorbacteria bacterium]